MKTYANNTKNTVSKLRGCTHVTNKLRYAAWGNTVHVQQHTTEYLTRLQPYTKH